MPQYDYEYEKKRQVAESQSDDMFMSDSQAVQKMKNVLIDVRGQTIEHKQNSIHKYTHCEQYSLNMIASSGLMPSSFLMIVSDADRHFKIALSTAAFKKDKIIQDCNKYIVGGGQKDPPPPWWIIMAQDLLEILYESVDLRKDAIWVTKFIMTLSVKAISSDQREYISKEEKLAVVDSMLAIHEHDSDLISSVHDAIKKYIVDIRAILLKEL